MNPLSERERAIFDLLQDDRSREIFYAWKRYAELGDNADLWRLTDHPAGFDAAIEKLKAAKYILYGAGAVCKKLVSYLWAMDVIDNCLCIWDRDSGKAGTEIGGLKVTLPDPALRFDYALPAVSEKFRPELFAEIIDFLEHIGVTGERIIKPYYTILENPDAYFDKDIIQPRLGDNEVFVDGGCYDFATSRRFIEVCGESGAGVKAVHAFEPDETLAVKCRKNSAAYPFAVVHRAGLWSENTTLSFYTHTESGSLQVGGSEMSIPVVALDQCLPKEENVTFIKFDIEGAELEALRGAEETIRRDKPKLAICIYHKPLDYVDIPEYIHSLVPEYKMYIRVYGGGGSDTVLYCVKA